MTPHKRLNALASWALAHAPAGPCAARQLRAHRSCASRCVRGPRRPGHPNGRRGPSLRAAAHTAAASCRRCPSLEGKQAFQHPAHSMLMAASMSTTRTPPTPASSAGLDWIFMIGRSGLRSRLVPQALPACGASLLQIRQHGRDGRLGEVACDRARHAWAANSGMRHALPLAQRLQSCGKRRLSFPK